MSHDTQIYAADKPNVVELLRNYTESLSELEHWLDQCQVAYDDRRNYWPGKRADQRKAGATAFPWEGSSDQESNVVGSRVQCYVSLCMFALSRAHIRAYPVEATDTGRARLVSSFLKWMRDSYIKDFAREMELGANYLFEKGHMITYIGWEQREVTRLQQFDLQQIAQQAPEFAEMLMDESNDEQVVAMLQSQFPKLKAKRAKKVLQTLRKDGFAELPVSVKGVDRPLVQALATDSDVFWPSYTTDPQTAPFVHRRVLYTPQEILNRQATEGWDKKWCAYVIEKLAGIGTINIDAKDRASQTNSPVGRFQESKNDLIEVIHTYQRLISDDGAEGIYCTIWHKGHTLDNAHAYHSLQNGLDNYPFIFTEMERSTKRIYDTRSMVDLLRGTQWQVKAERDARVDRASLATLPPSKGPIGREKPEIRPGGHVFERRPGEYGWADPPPLDPGSIEVESTMLRQADHMVGLSDDDPDAQVKKAYYINKFLKHVRDVLGEAYKAYIRYGPDELEFRVSGVPEGMQFQKGDPNMEMDITVQFDAQMSDPDTVEAKLSQLLQLVQYDRTGKINMESLLEVAAAAVDPVLADMILQPQEQAQAKMINDITDDLAKIYAGVEVGARPTGAEIAMQVAQKYTQQPDVAERLSNDEHFAQRLEKYFKQYQFQLDQAKNAEIGKLGTDPADFQGVQQG